MGPDGGGGTALHASQPVDDRLAKPGDRHRRDRLQPPWRRAARRPQSAHMTPVLDIRGYSLDYALRSGAVRALEAIDLSIAKGEAVGLVGESGSGKTSLAWAILRYLPTNAVERSGQILLSGEDLRTQSAKEIAAIRGRRISMVFQDP